MQAATTIVGAKRTRRGKRIKVRGASSAGSEGMDIVPHLRIPAADTRLATQQYVRKKFRSITGKEELKYEDLYNNNVTAATAGYFACANNLTQGTTALTRVGDSVTVTSVQLRLNTHNGTSTQEVVYRVMLLWDYDVGGALPASANILATGLVITDPTLAPYNRNYVGKDKRFKIIFDRNFTHKQLVYWNATANAVNSETCWTSQIIEKIRTSRKVQYAGNTGTIADITTNSLIICIWANRTDAQQFLDYGLRVYYKDE